MMSTVQEIAFKFDYSAKSLTAFTEELSENENVQDQLERRTKLRTLCETRWSSRADSLYTFRTAFEVVVSALNSLKDDNDDKAAQSMNAILRFEFIISLVVAEHILSATVALANYLQKTDIDLIESLTEAKSVIQRLPDERGDDTVWESLFTRATDIAAEHDIEPSVPRVAGRQRHRANHPIIEPSDYWRVSLYYVFLDHLVAEITKRLISNEERFLASYFIPAKLGNLTPEIADKIYNSYRSDLGVISTTYQYCAIHNSGYEAIVSRSSKQLTSIDSCAWFCNDTNSFAVQVQICFLKFTFRESVYSNIALLVVQQIINVRLLVVQHIIDVRLLVVQQIIDVRLLVVQQIIDVRLLGVQQIIDVRLLVVQQIINVRLLVVQQIIDVRLLVVQQIIDVRLLVVQQIINSTGSMMICECVFGSTNIIHHKVDDILCLPFTCKDENNDDKPCGMSQVMAVYSHDVTNFDSTRVMFSETEVNLADDDHSKPLTVEIGNGTSEDKIITGISISKINFAISNFTFEYSGESCSSSESFQRYTEFNPQMFDASTIHMIEPLRTSCLRLTIYPSDTTLPVNPRCRVILYKPSEDYVTADRIGIYGYYHDSTVDSSEITFLMKMTGADNSWTADVMKIFRGELNCFNTDNIDLRLLESSCLIIWAETSQSDLESEKQLKDNCINFTKNMFNKCPLQSNEAVNINVTVKCSELFQGDLLSAQKNKKGRAVRILKEEENFLRIAALMRFAIAAVRVVFENQFHGDALERSFDEDRNLLVSLARQGILSQSDFKQIYHRPGRSDLFLNKFMRKMIFVGALKIKLK
ncbi:unnamed protein product [Mytilus edulis]|uniref:Uncharacterized protein n=1 Tax=Mytilus edulis TaxID=6550 RepID=A0A8S3TTZ6_MYTED|nr:unnamed protein product [Mytilus edulis]